MFRSNKHVKTQLSATNLGFSSDPTGRTLQGPCRLFSPSELSSSPFVSGGGVLSITSSSSVSEPSSELLSVSLRTGSASLDLRFLATLRFIENGKNVPVEKLQQPMKTQHFFVFKTLTNG
jgi:hypothetical protein